MSEPVPETSSPFIHVASLAELERRGVIPVSVPGGRVAVFADGGRAWAVDNRCPHMGFPLDRGTVVDGILTCHWHQARFDLGSGCTFDLWADDVPRYETRVEGGEVYVLPEATLLRDAAHHRRRLRKGVELDVPLVQAKSLLGLLDLDADLVSIVRDVALYAGRNLQRFGEGMVRLTCIANLYPYLSRETAYQGLFYAVRQIASETAGSVARRDREPLGSGAHDTRTLRRWLRQWVQTRHRDAIERTLLTGLRSAAVEDFADLLLGAASERLFAQTGHVLDAANKAIELALLLGWETAPEIVPLLVPAISETRGEEESTAWRHPIEIVEPLRAIEARLPKILAESSRDTLDPDARAALSERLLGDDPHAILQALEDALARGADPAQLARQVAHAASLRLARFATSNEVTDWFNPQHTLNFSNAVHQAVVRKTSPDTVRGIFQAAIAVYIDRYLNVPPARLPAERELEALPRDPEAIRTALLELLDQRSQIDAAAQLVARHLRLGHPVAALIDTLTFAAVREDIDFHSLQVIEASARQSAAWGPEHPQETEQIWVGAVRNLAAHCPTRRAGQQTAQIALRLHRGDRVFEEEAGVIG